MYKNRIAVFFSILFLTFIIAPTVISLVDSSVDISFIYSSSEEESNNKQLEKVKIILAPFNISDLVFSSTKKVSALTHTNKNYTKPYLNLVFPPPEHF